MANPSEPAEPDLKYTCPICGQEAVFGRHFCPKLKKYPRPSTPKRPRPARIGGVPPWIWSVVGALLVAALLWSWLGFWSLVLVSVGLLILFSLERSGGQKVWPLDSPYEELVKIAQGQETADRLIAFELTRDPALSRSEAVDQALQRYKRDLGR